MALGSEGGRGLGYADLSIVLARAFRERALRLLKGPKLSVFLCLALHEDDDWVSSLEVERIMAETGYGFRTVNAALADLVKMGFVTSAKEEQKPDVVGIAKRNPYIPDFDDQPSPLFAPPCLMVTILEHDDGQKEYVLADSFARAVNQTQFREIVAVLTPFYEATSDEEIADFNREQESYRQQRRERRSSRPRPKRGLVPGYVYLLQAGPYYKIGVSQDVDKRVEQLATIPPFDLELVCTIPTEDMYGLERELHERFDAKRKNGEWFELDEADVEHIRNWQVSDG
jgi:hypothetical protein